MSFKRRVGNFLILFGLVAFLVFAASLLLAVGAFIFGFMVKAGFGV